MEAAHEFDGGKGVFLLDWNFSYAGSMFWNKGGPTSVPRRRKNFIRMSFASIRASAWPLTFDLLPICLRIPRRGEARAEQPRDGDANEEGDP